MTLPVVTSVYAGLSALMLFALSLRVIAQRSKARIALGHGGDAQLERRIRVQANFTEYVPLALVLMMLLEMVGMPSWCLHLLGVVLLLGRSVRAWGLEAANLPGRQFGMALTFTVLASRGLLALAAASWSLL